MPSTGSRTRWRRGTLAWLAAAALSTSAPTTQAQSLRTELLVSGINTPVSMRQPQGESRIFVLSEPKGIFVIENGAVLPNLFLDLTQQVAGASERVLGMEFHPDYVNNGRFWVSYMDASDQSHLVEYLRDANDPNRADESTALHLFGPTQQPSNIHNWYDMHFGPDGMFYLAFGDGGGANDPNENAQDLSVLFGKILRIDVDSVPRGSYAIPPDNPFANLPGIAGEIWHSGVRSPWRFSFDRETGDFYLGDVGQAQWEEINFAPAGLGGLNFGWRCMEASRCTGLMNCGCGDPSWTDPIIEYPHDNRCAVMGGYVYRGSLIPWLQGKYFYADYCSARIWSVEYDGTTLSNLTEHTTELAPMGGSIGPIMGFGEDANGELYILDRGNGEIWQIKSDNCNPGDTICTANPNSADSDGAQINMSGCRSISENNITLSVSGLPVDEYGMFFYGPQQAPVPFGQGTLCVGGLGGVFRLRPALRSSTEGGVLRALDLNAAPSDSGPGMITPGSTWSFQFWYRDPGLGFNLSDGLSISFEP